MDSRSSWYTGLLLDHSVRDKWGGLTATGEDGVRHKKREASEASGTVQGYSVLFACLFS